MSDFKAKIERVKEIFSGFEKLEKSVQVQLMNVADRMAPMVQGGKIAPKEMPVPEPVEYPDISVKPAPSVKKHALEEFAERFAKEEWNPVLLKVENPLKTSSGKSVHLLGTSDGNHGPQGKHLDSRAYGGHGSMAQAHHNNMKLVHEAHPNFTTKDHAEAAKKTGWPQSSAHSSISKQKKETYGQHDVTPPSVAKKSEIVGDESFGKTQKHPSPEIPYTETPGHKDYINSPENVSSEMRHLRDAKKNDFETFSDSFGKSSWKPALLKAATSGVKMPAKTGPKPPAKNIPDEPSKKKTM